MESYTARISAEASSGTIPDVMLSPLAYEAADEAKGRRPTAAVALAGPTVDEARSVNVLLLPLLLLLSTASSGLLLLPPPVAARALGKEDVMVVVVEVDR